MAFCGHTKIELTDVHTGAVEVVEQHNLVTGAVGEWLRPVGAYTVPYRAVLSESVSALYGGVVLFDTPVAGDENTFFPAESNHPVGYAEHRLVNDTEAAWLGSCNLAESGIDAAARTATFVYDFASSQGNGQIASVCLMPRGCGAAACFGMMGEDPDPGPGDSLDRITELYGVDGDPEEGRAVQYRPLFKMSPYDGSDATACAEYAEYTLIYRDFEREEAVYYNKAEKTVTRWRTWDKRVSLFRGLLDSWDKVSEQPIVIPEGAGEPLRCEGEPAQYYDAAHFCLFCIKRVDAEAGYAHCYTMLVYEIETGALTKTVSFTLPSEEDVLSSTAARGCGIFYLDGYILLANGPDGRWYRISEENPTDIQEAVFEQGRPERCGRYLAFAENGLAVIRSRQLEHESEPRRNHIWRVRENHVCMTATGFGGAGTGVYYANKLRHDLNRQVRGCGLAYLFSDCCGNTALDDVRQGALQRVKVFLSTINDLSEPVIKTADKTMKITYTLQEVDEAAVPEEGEA